MSTRLSTGLIIPNLGLGYYGTSEIEARRIGKEGFGVLDNDVAFLYDRWFCAQHTKELAIQEGRETYGVLEGEIGLVIAEDDQGVVIARDHLKRVKVSAFNIYNVLNGRIEWWVD